MLPISAPENSTTAQTSAGKDAREPPRCSRFLKQNGAVEREIAAGSAEHRGDDVGKAVGAEFPVEVGGFLPRHFQARHVEQHGDGGDAAHRANFRAARGKHAPIDLVLHHRRDRPPQSELADARQEPSVAHRLVMDEAEQDDVHDHEEADEGDRQRKIGRHQSPQKNDGRGEDEADKDLRPIDRRVEHGPACRREREVGLGHHLDASGDQQPAGGSKKSGDNRVRDEAEPLA